MTLLPASCIQAADTVVLVHGLGLGPWAMRRLEKNLAADGYRVVNLGYASRSVPLETLAAEWLPAQLAAHDVSLDPARGETFHLVTHSMGGLIVRGWLHAHGVPPTLGRVVMLAPPNHGTRLIDRLNTVGLARVTGINGPRLGTTPTAYPATLPDRWPTPGPVLGILAGDRPLNPLTAALTGGPGDGKVTVASTHLAGATAHRVLPVSHTWIQYRRLPIDHVRHFLRTGTFPPE